MTEFSLLLHSIALLAIVWLFNLIIRKDQPKTKRYEHFMPMARNAPEALEMLKESEKNGWEYTGHHVSPDGSWYIILKRETL